MSQTPADLAQLLAIPSLELTVHPPNSRYHGQATRSMTLPDGREVRYLAPCTPPEPDSMSEIGRHVVVAGDRLDGLAERYLGDAMVNWRIADANGARLPDELTERAGRVLRIAVPGGGR